MLSIGHTRMNLLAIKGQLKVAAHSVELLRSKREALIRELFSMMDHVVVSREQVDETMKEACASLTVALGLDGPAPIRSAGYAARRNFPIAMTERQVWGVRLPELHYPPVVRSLDARGYAISGVSSSINEAAQRFEKGLEQILHSIEVEMHLKKLGAELKKVTRRINAINDMLIPSLRHHIREIYQALDERGREDMFRMRRFKAKS